MEEKDLVEPNPQETMDEDTTNIGVLQIGTTGEYLEGAASPHQVKQEPEEHCWEAYENCLDLPVKVEVLAEDSSEVSETLEKVFSSPTSDHSPPEIQWTHLPLGDKPEADWESIFSGATTRAAGEPAATPQPPSQRKRRWRVSLLPPTPVQGMAEEEEDLLQPTTFSPEPAEEGELWSPAAGSLLPSTHVQGLGEEEPWHPVIHHPLPPRDVETWEGVGEPGPACRDHQGCQEHFQRVRVLRQIIAQQHGIMAKQGALIQEQHEVQEQNLQLLKNLLQQPSK